MKRLLCAVAALCLLLCACGAPVETSAPAETTLPPVTEPVIETTAPVETTAPAVQEYTLRIEDPETMLYAGPAFLSGAVAMVTCLNGARTGACGGSGFGVPAPRSVAASKRLPTNASMSSMSRLPYRMV